MANAPHRNATAALEYELIINSYQPFCGPGRAVDRLCVCVCVCLCVRFHVVTFERNDFIPRYLIWRFI